MTFSTLKPTIALLALMFLNVPATAQTPTPVPPATDLKRLSLYELLQTELKPLGLQQFLDVVKSIEDFWFTIVKLPPRQ